MLARHAVRAARPLRRSLAAPRSTVVTERARPPTVVRRSLYDYRTPAAQAAAAIDKPVGYWLLGCGGLVAGMVSVGGLTRLTRSGLSMTDWKIQGGLPPQTPDEWQREFERYKRFPEWQQRQSMTVEDFKFIYFWEYGHRMLGRVVGVAFGVPLAYFWSRGRLTPWLKPRLLGLLGLGGTQGLVGWWMVRSGLDTQLLPEKQRQDVRVSPYRLATHLSLAFASYTGLVWCGLEVLSGGRRRGRSSRARARAPRRRAARAGLTFVTALSGAFVAGNDAGCAYNVWPYMIDDRDFDHRSLAYATSAAVGALAASAAAGPFSGAAARAPASPSPGPAAVGQVSLGVATLLAYVPIELAAAHQAGSLVLLTTMLGAASATPPTAGGAGATALKAARRQAGPAAGVAVGVVAAGAGLAQA
ncbi:Cytochrome C oxidase assembly protein [Aureococcus anophagefferens]|uniref:Cytochrome C oxidase assembly protein n=1 Tax=Aureococcus anophagefferens TaxID=44056 RepID=A0ABR1FY31_AURAN